ncbi:dihydropteridine reductase, NAD(P)H-dependent, oxygen-insensitive [Pseudomonas sp. 8Z]|uniref:oxygen-insensitive NAD(P)H nitroreductase n=1 Tax=Pseudomonas sp. 8Z TaxID=2653166 RepID=UPI0012EF8CAE|nr:oxygen-insensitive NAD(P)H nitroreductase [Pseudomonas sp. 8Z]VXC63273.1 dihydropteridine reductase, NAD(P)H-dependent, oxygen-insensitive [Pseudomonas sp. 8Z]
MSLVSFARKRYTTKAYDASRQVDQATVEQLLELLRLSPSSVNSQPWHFVVASSAEGKARLAKGTQGAFAYNQPKVLDASHVILICTQRDMSDTHLAVLLGQESADGRFRDEAARITQQNTRNSYVNLHRELGDISHWMEKQAYLALGSLLLGAASLGLDATPMEGIDREALDAELGLAERGLSSLVMVSLGYHSDGDFNAALPKSRLPAERVFTRL